MTAPNTTATVPWQIRRVCSVVLSVLILLQPRSWKSDFLTLNRWQATLHSLHTSLPLFCTPSPTTFPRLPPHFAAVGHRKEDLLSYAIYGLKDGEKGIKSQRLKVTPLNPRYGQKTIHFLRTLEQGFTSLRKEFMGCYEAFFFFFSAGNLKINRQLSLNGMWKIQSINPSLKLFESIIYSIVDSSVRKKIERSR